MPLSGGLRTELRISTVQDLQLDRGAVHDAGASVLAGVVCEPEVAAATNGRLPVGQLAGASALRLSRRGVAAGDRGDGRVPFEKILVATDLSEITDRLIGRLQMLKPLGVRAVALVHALGIRHLVDMKYLLAPRVEPQLRAQAALVAAQGFATTWAIVPGLPGEELSRAACEQHASMIVAGMRHASGVRAALGSRAIVDILHHAPVPVLAMPIHVVEDRGTPASEAARSDLTRRLLHPTDFSEAAQRAFTYVEKCVEKGTRWVTLLHVQDEARIGTHARERLEECSRIDQARLERLKADLERKGATDVRIEIRVGFPSQEIVRCAERVDGSVIVMGSRGRGVMSGMVLGSVSHHIVRQAPVPVLLIPPAR